MKAKADNLDAVCVCRVEDRIRSESTIHKGQASFPEHNYNNILKVWTNMHIKVFLSSLGMHPVALHHSVACCLCVPVCSTFPTV